MSTYTRTQAQSRASEPLHNVWVSANAGTGKTGVLVDRIARLLLAGARPEKILCLTFTKTGAAEMAKRINTLLGGWAVMDDAALAQDLEALIGAPPNHDIQGTARKLFAQVLDVPGGLKIRTIHSFCESLIGRFPIEAQVAPHFSVIDERTTAELLVHARERILERTIKTPDSELAHALNHLAELVNEDGFISLMQTLTGKRARLAEVKAHYATLGGIDAATTKLVGLSEHETSETAILTAATSERVMNKAALKDAAKALMNGTVSSQKMGAALTAYLAQSDDQCAQTFLVDHTPLFVTKAFEPRKKLTTKGAEAAEEALLDEQFRVLEILEKLRARATADATVSLLIVGQAMVDGYEHLKRVRAYLDYDDLINTAKSLLSTEGGVSWVHFKLDGGIDHILVDESQDTSPAQWDVVQSLATDFHSGLGRHEEQTEAPRTVFAVGDEKQSIYSFQGADPLEFGRRREHFETRVSAVGQDFKKVQLMESFRTVEAVLRVVDRVFAQPGVSEGLTFDGQYVNHKTSRVGEAGRVELWPTFKSEAAEKDDPWDAPLDYQNQKSAELQLADKIAETIDGWLTNGERLVAQNRAIRPGDILILVRRRARFAEAMISSLKKRAIAVAGADRMILTDQIAVMDILAAGRFAVLPEDSLAMAELLKSPLVGWDDDTLFTLAHDRPTSLWAELAKRRNENETFAKAHGYLSRLLGKADFTPPYEFFADLLQNGGRKSLLGRLGVDAQDPLDEFLSLALDFERTHTPSLQGFLQWVTAGGTQIKRDMETSGNEVRVMTVHGAKGLEAPIVFLTDTCKAVDGRTDAHVQWGAEKPEVLWTPYKDVRCKTFTRWTDQARQTSEHEYRRLLYVAMTRARDRLYVTGYEDKQGRAEGCWYNLIAGVMGEVGKPVPCWDETEPLVRYETEQQVALKDAKAEEETSPLSPLPDWAFKPAPMEPTPGRPFSPSKIEPEAPPAFGPFVGDNTDRFKRGVLVHKLLETLPDLDVELRQAAAQRWLALPGHELDEKTQGDILAETFKVLTDEKFAPLFATGSLAEVSLSGVIGDRVVSARLDRLAIGDDEVTVIDYKTNRPAPTDAKNVPEAYIQQMATYRTLLASIYPTHRIRCVLLWTDGPHAMVLDDDLLKTYALSASPP